MVLYKRKPVIFSRPPEMPQDLSQEVWYIPQTKEWFLEYNDYLKRMDYYLNRKFVCEITGNSCSTFFEALKSESNEIYEVEKNFPESLKEHVLRFLQFNQTSRLDQLVDSVYANFKNDYFPGETIFIKGISHMNQSGQIENIHESIKQRGTIREKVQYGQQDNLTTKYLVVRLNDQSQSIVTNDQISRDRNHFTKWLIKTFVKLTVCRSHKVGAPWVVKEKYCHKYRIPKEYPDHLLQYQDSTPTGETLYEPVKVQRTKNVAAPSVFKAAPPVLAPKKQPLLLSDLSILIDLKASVREKKKFPTHYLPETIFRDDDGLNAKAVIFGVQPNKKNIVDDLKIRFDIQNPKPTAELLAAPENALVLNNHIIDELKSENENSSEIEEEVKRLSLSKIQSVEEALQCWAFLNMFHKSLHIDTFTFDDFIYSMSWNHQQYEEHGKCDLLDEIWCSVLCAILSNDQTVKKFKHDEVSGLTVNIPSKKLFEKQQQKIEKEQNSQKDTQQDTQQENQDSNGATDTIETGTTTNGKQKQFDDSERGSESETEEKLLKSDDENESSDELEVKREVIVLEDASDREDADDENEDDGEDDDENDEDDDEEFDHHAYSIMNHRKITWHERLRKRNFKDGNWQSILLGVLSLIEYLPQYKEVINKVFKILAPKSMPATIATVLGQFYDSLDIELRIQVLNILVNLLLSGSVVRKHIEESLEASTSLRRSRLDNIKDYKTQLETAQKAHTYLFDDLSKHRSQNSTTKGEKGDEITIPVLKRPRLNYKATTMTEEEAAYAKENEKFAAVWNEKKEALIKLERIKKEKREFENELTELDCQRVKLLGKDRLYNRYWWFENNGLPTLRGNSEEDDEDDDIVEIKNKDDDSDDEEVLNDTYLMGKLWVQGPSNNDLEVHFGTDFKTSQEYNQLNNKLETESHDVIHVDDEGTTDAMEIDNDKIKNGTDENIRKMDFTLLPQSFKTSVSEMFGVSFKSNEITLNDEIVINNEGGITDVKYIEGLTPWQRKAIEECPHLLANGSSWSFYDKPEDINKLLQWLNPWGKRESVLRKEIINVKDILTASMEARRKALFIDGIPADEYKLQNNIEKVQEHIKKLEVENHEVVDVSNDDDDDEDDSITRKRNKRNGTAHIKKQKKLESVQDVINSGNLGNLRSLLSDLNEQLKQKKQNVKLTRVIEWVNSAALDKFERSLYEGGDKKKAAKSKKR